MARPKKTGLDYFPLDVHFMDDIKVIKLTDEYGTAGLAVYMSVLSKIYSEGYYLECDITDLACSLVRNIGGGWINRKQVIEILNACAEYGLLDKELFGRGVYTSVGIQKRYSEVTKRSKADIAKYRLIEEEKQDIQNNTENKNDIAENESDGLHDMQSNNNTENDDNEKSDGNDEKNEPKNNCCINDELTGVFAAKTPQSKVKKSKVKKRKVNETKSNESKVKESKAEENKTEADETVLEIYCEDGAYPITSSAIEQYKTKYKHTDVFSSLCKLSRYLSNRTDKSMTAVSLISYIRMWLEKDERDAMARDQEEVSSAASKPRSTYDISSYDSCGSDIFRFMDEEDRREQD